MPAVPVCVTGKTGRGYEENTQPKEKITAFLSCPRRAKHDEARTSDLNQSGGTLLLADRAVLLVDDLTVTVHRLQHDVEAP